jgi:gliding motility-associated-like protein
MKHPLMKHIYLLLWFLLVFIGYNQAQTCTIVNNDTVICQGAMVSFAVNTTGGTPVAYSWNFGNGFTASTASPAHTYTSGGVFTPTVTVTFVGGASCTVLGKTIRVFGAPNANFAITTDRTMCFKDNILCIQDLSTPGSSNAPLKKRVYQLSNGFLQIDFPPYSSQICYQDITDVSGYVFSLVMEVTDSNHCVGKFQKKDSVELYPKQERLDYQAIVTDFCTHSLVSFTNTSVMPLSRVLKFKWVFGDGKVDSMNWLNTTHDYTNQGTSYPILIVQDKQLCIDTVNPKVEVVVLSPNPGIFFKTPTRQCLRGNEFTCYSPNAISFGFNWSVTEMKTGNSVIYNSVSTADTNFITFKAGDCGAFKVSLDLVRGSCLVHFDTIVHVMGPKAVMETEKFKIVNGKQCQIKDTVYFVTPLPYLSCVYQNGLGLKHLWSFDDSFAPQCTVDTRRGINIGLNCNFSKDSAGVNHFYKPGEENCYFPRLFIKDTIQGCFDSTSVKLPLMSPDASPAPSANPPRKGLFTLDSIYCFGDVVGFIFDILPQCNYTKAYINVDSACGKNNWLFADSVGKFQYSKVYTSTCSPDGYVTVGLVIGNGSDSLGNICYDTAWFHNIINLSPINPRFKMVKTNNCKPYHITFVPEDSTQYNLVSAFWSLKTGITPMQDTITQFLLPTDSIVHSQSAIYDSAGVYLAYSLFTNNRTCFKTSFVYFGLGFKTNFGTPNSTACLNDSIRLNAEVFYYNANYPGYRHPVDYWGNKARAAAGLEQVWWDIGDGNGFVHTGDSVKVKFPKPGKYTIKMMAKDSLGCFDTIVKPDFITVVGVEAHIGQITQTYYCAPQIVLFKDSSRVFDSVPYTTPSLIDAVTSWRWDFGDFTLESLLKNAGHNYTSNGLFTVRLIAFTTAGCSDTDYAEVNIAGPTPSFTIKDTLGCAPFTAVFDNTTNKQLKSWTWYFGDSANQTLTTLNDSNVKFTYTKPGVYYIKLLASQDVTNPTTGNTSNCNSFFPDPVTGLPTRLVYVFPTPPVDLEIKDTICVGEEVTFTSHSDTTAYKRFVWRLSAGDSVLMNTPDTVTTYIFDSSGKHKVSLVAKYNSLGFCLGSASKDVNVLNVNAAFTIDSSKAPQFYFQNQSSSAIRYKWDFGKPQQGAKNESDEQNPSFYYGPDTGSYIVCLMAFNELDCWDTTCETITISQVRLNIPNVFTPDNNDGYNDAFDIDIVGFTEYHLTIYNRWGAKVFEGSKDGFRNDGINWNGNNQQDGRPCPAGTYYYIFTYQFYTEKTPQTLHGTITLIRDQK